VFLTSGSEFRTGKYLLLSVIVRNADNCRNRNRRTASVELKNAKWTDPCSGHQLLSGGFGGCEDSFVFFCCHSFLE